VSAPNQVQEVVRLLVEERLSQRCVALRTGVSRGTVHAIARGKRRDSIHRVEEDEEDWSPAGPLVRCPTCGGKVLMPCLLCRLRRMQRRQRRRRR
jgi:DNA-directed RNA polymerase subunit RPC12/RpoP